MVRIFTVGHSTHPQDEFARLLLDTGIEELVDVRTAAGSRRHPQFNRSALEEWVPASGIAYRWEGRLGGFRKLPPNSPDVALRHESFRAYAAHMRTEEFESALRELIDGSGQGRTAVMCSEAVWWRCHRRMISDHLVLLDGCEVLHLMPDGKTRPHRVTEGARVDGDQLIYDVVAE